MNNKQLHSRLKSLIQKFEANKYHYLSKNYLEEEVKIDFINPLFEALGWDVRNTKGLSPYEREVVVEKGETVGHPDYNFRIDGQTKFFVEAKAPHEPLHKINHVLQAKSYAWNTKNVFIVLLTDFEEFRLFDASIKPDAKNPDQGLIFELTYDQYLDNIDKLMLLSREEVEKGSLDKLILKDSVSRKLRIPVDKAFLQDLSQWREELAKDIYKRNIKELEDRSDEKKVKIQVKILNEAVQKTLDRLIFIRIAEDRKIIEPKSLLDEVEWWKAGGKRRDLHRRLTDCFMGWNQDFNGEILKPGPCDVLGIDSHLLAKIVEGLYFPKCPYLFDVIGVELLGSIYERYLGKTIRVTPKRVKIEEKPEVRKAVGVYYTPQYIVDYIVKNTVAKVIKGKTPKQIEKIKILDPACGSGSFLLTAFQTLIDYHLTYYEKHPEELAQGTLFPDVIVNYGGSKRLSIEKKTQILRNNIFGVDIDPQAVEITMMSLYLKCLEGEKDLPRKKELLPSLAKNIRCGNSLISYDIFDQLTLFDDEEKERINPFDWYSKSTGFGDIMEKGGFDVVIGNPPYVSVESTSKDITDFYLKSFNTAYGRVNAFSLFFEKAISLLKDNGSCGLLTSNRILTNIQLAPLRKLILNKCRIEKILSFKKIVFGAAVDTSVIIFRVKLPLKEHCIQVFYDIIDLTVGDFKVNTIHQFTFLENQAYIYNIKQSENYKQIIQRIQKKSVLLENICTVKDGIILGSIKDLFLSNNAKDSRYEKWLEGNEVSKYLIKWCGRYICYDHSLIEEEIKRKVKKAKEKAISSSDFEKLSSSGVRLRKLEIFKQEKILTRQNAKRLIGTFDDDNFFVKNSLHCILKKKNKYNLKYILGLINSKAMDFYFRDQIGSTGEIFSQMKIAYIRKLPICVIDFNNQNEKTMHNRIVELVDKMLELNKKRNTLPPSSKREKIEREIQITDEKIDALVYDLYGIKEEERKIIEKMEER